jgi:hypothetical protein
LHCLTFFKPIPRLCQVLCWSLWCPEMAPITQTNLESISAYWYAPFCCVYLGCRAVKFRISGGTYELPCLFPSTFIWDVLYAVVWFLYVLCEHQRETDTKERQEDHFKPETLNINTTQKWEKLQNLHEDISYDVGASRNNSIREHVTRAFHCSRMAVFLQAIMCRPRILAISICPVFLNFAHIFIFWEIFLQKYTKLNILSHIISDYWRGLHWMIGFIALIHWTRNYK